MPEAYSSHNCESYMPVIFWFHQCLPKPGEIKKKKDKQTFLKEEGNIFFNRLYLIYHLVPSPVWLLDPQKFKVRGRKFNGVILYHVCRYGV